MAGQGAPPSHSGGGPQDPGASLAAALLAAMARQQQQREMVAMARAPGPGLSEVLKPEVLAPLLQDPEVRSRCCQCDRGMCLCVSAVRACVFVARAACNARRRGLCHTRLNAGARLERRDILVTSVLLVLRRAASSAGSGAPVYLLARRAALKGGIGCEFQHSSTSAASWRVAGRPKLQQQQQQWVLQICNSVSRFNACLALTSFLCVCTLQALAHSPQFHQQLATFGGALQTGQLDLAQFGLQAEVRTYLACLADTPVSSSRQVRSLPQSALSSQMQDELN